MLMMMKMKICRKIFSCVLKDFFEGCKKVLEDFEAHLLLKFKVNSFQKLTQLHQNFHKFATMLTIQSAKSYSNCTPGELIELKIAIFFSARKQSFLMDMKKVELNNE